jgi:hypothetical protein
LFSFVFFAFLFLSFPPSHFYLSVSDLHAIFPTYLSVLAL